MLAKLADYWSSCLLNPELIIDADYWNAEYWMLASCMSYQFVIKYGYDSTVCVLSESDIYTMF